VGRRALSALALGLLLAAGADADPATEASALLQAMEALPAAPRAPAPDVVFQTLEGKRARLADFRGRPVVLTFFTTW
jgi:cytochrome oxidase Cu insertion factor (SCO1/SenC/PrrC family)